MTSPCATAGAAEGARPRGAFTLIELLIVIAILALLVAILLPGLAAAEEHARLARVLIELRGIATALHTYADDHNDRAPPTRTYCDLTAREHWCELPRELVDGGYLPAGSADGEISSKMEDLFDPGHTYKYQAPGWGFHNNCVVPKTIWVPDAFPHDDPAADADTLAGRTYDNVTRPVDDRGTVVRSPVKWAIWSVGPLFRRHGQPKRAPVARCSWYHGHRTHGVIPYIYMEDGRSVPWTARR